MNYLDKYKEFIQKYIPLNENEWEFFKTKLSIKEFKKGENILRQGEVCKELYFIAKGLARGYIIDESGKDFTWCIYFNDLNSKMTNLYVTDYASFLYQESSDLFIEALEDTVLVTYAFEDLKFMYEKMEKAEKIGRIMAELAYTYLHKKIINHQTKNANERFEEFMDETPYLLEKVPQYHIATFLGITPQHLSRLKKEYKINKC